MMRPKRSVFGSNEESKQFKKLKNNWGNQFSIYHNLPFLSVFEGKESVSAEDFEFLKKTSIDYVVCSPEGSPILAIEFDGLQHGHNTGTVYHSGPGGLGRKSRKRNIELKLQIAHEANFPLFVLSGSHFKNLGDGLQLSIVDGLIGEVLATTQTHRIIREGFKPENAGYSEVEFENLSPVEQHEVIEDWLIGVEVSADYENNPIFQKVSELASEIGISSESIFYPNEEGIDIDKWALVYCSVVDRKGNSAETRVCIPNFQTPGCYCTVHIAQEIGKLVCLEQLRRKK